MEEKNKYNNFIIQQIITLLIAIICLTHGGWMVSFINTIYLHIEIEKKQFGKIPKIFFIINILIFIISFSYSIYSYNI